MNSLLIITFFALVIIGFKKPLLGILVLLVLNCTFTIPTEFISISLPGLGILLLSDIVIISLAIKSIKTIKSQWNNIPEIKLFIALVGCFVFSGFILTLLGNIAPNESFRLIAREGLVWLVPFNVLGLNETEKRNLIKSLVAISLFVCAIQFYFLLNPNVSLIAQAYYQFKSQDDPVIAAQFVFDNQTPRLYPAGTLLVQMVLGFVAAIMILKVIALKNIYKKLLLVLSLGAAMIFTYTLGGRSNLLAMVITIFFVVVYKNKASFTKIIYSIFLTIGITVGVILIDNMTNLNVFSAIVEKTETQFAAQGTEYLFYDRRSDNEDAINEIIHSPLWGIGRSNTGKESELGSGQDAHGVLALGLQVGIIGIILFLILFFKIYKRTKKIKRSKKLKEIWSLPSIYALIPATILLLLNTTQSIIGLKNLLPVAIFVGLILSEFRKRINKTIVSNA